MTFSISSLKFKLHLLTDSIHGKNRFKQHIDFPSVNCVELNYYILQHINFNHLHSAFVVNLHCVKYFLQLAVNCKA